MPQHPPFCCTAQPIPASATNSHLLTSFLQALTTIFHRPASRRPPTPTSSRSSTSTYYTAHSQLLKSSSSLPPQAINLFPPYPPKSSLPLSIIELETIQNIAHHARQFSHRYFVELDGSWHEKQMFPESFAEAKWQRVEEMWRRCWEWVLRDDVGELGKRRVGWRCESHGWGYWVREIRWADEGEAT